MTIMCRNDELSLTLSWLFTYRFRDFYLIWRKLTNPSQNFCYSHSLNFRVSVSTESVKAAMYDRCLSESSLFSRENDYFHSSVSPHFQAFVVRSAFSKQPSQLIILAHNCHITSLSLRIRSTENELCSKPYFCFMNAWYRYSWFLPITLISHTMNI